MEWGVECGGDIDLVLEGGKNITKRSGKGADI